MPSSTTIRRLADRARYDRETLDAILDDAYVAHVGVVVDGAPVVLPFACARAGDELVLHGSTRAGTLSLIADGTPVCATVTHIDGLVLARSGFHSSMNYRSVAIHGVARAVTERDEKIRLLDAVMDHLLPGRRAAIRSMNDGELEAVAVVAIPLTTFSAKVRTGGPKDAPEDLAATEIWGGVIPLQTTFGEPIPDAATAPGVTPPSVTR
jgi:nitroimidazol reductase NimA-like FMN-containing flavoprotein (pyridoxamine 5'-phosphate oxidase superfamily)